MALRATWMRRVTWQDITSEMFGAQAVSREEATAFGEIPGGPRGGENGPVISWGDALDDSAVL
mgnify:CR=1 FL=1